MCAVGGSRGRGPLLGREKVGVVGLVSVRRRGLRNVGRLGQVGRLRAVRRLGRMRSLLGVGRLRRSLRMVILGLGVRRLMRKL